MPNQYWKETVTQAALAAALAPWIVFTGQVSALRPIGHSLVRVTCSSAEFTSFAHNGYDQRIKLILPLPDSGYRNFPSGEG